MEGVRFLTHIRTIKNMRQATVYCDKSDCFASKKSTKDRDKYYCTCLADNDFGGKPCPFYKTHEEQADSLRLCEERRATLAKERKRKKQTRTISGVMFVKEEEEN